MSEEELKKRIREAAYEAGTDPVLLEEILSEFDRLPFERRLELLSRFESEEGLDFIEVTELIERYKPKEHIYVVRFETPVEARLIDMESLKAVAKAIVDIVQRGMYLKEKFEQVGSRVRRMLRAGRDFEEVVEFVSRELGVKRPRAVRFVTYVGMRGEPPRIKPVRMIPRRLMHAIGATTKRQAYRFARYVLERGAMPPKIPNLRMFREAKTVPQAVSGVEYMYYIYFDEGKKRFVAVQIKGPRKQATRTKAIKMARERPPTETLEYGYAESSDIKDIFRALPRVIIVRVLDRRGAPVTEEMLVVNTLSQK